MSTPQRVASRPTSFSGVSLVGLLLVIDSLHFVFARLLLPQIDPFVSALYVLGIGTLEVGVYGVVTGRLRLELLRHHWRFFVAIGLCVAVSTVINYAAVAYIDPGTASMLGKTSILYGLGFGVLWLGDRLSRLQVVGTGVALLGLVIVTFQPGDYLRLGSLLVLASSLLYSLHAALTKRFGSGMDLLNFFFYRLLLTSFFLFLIAGATGSLALPAGPVWPYLVLAGTVDVVISRTLYYSTLRRLDMSVFSIVLALSPVVAIAWSYFLFATFPSGPQLAGGMAVLVGVIAVTAAPALAWRQARRRERAPVPENA